MADALVITKADGENAKKAEMAARSYANAMHLFPPKSSAWIAPSFTCSALQNVNIDKVWTTIESHANITRINGWFDENRKKQDCYWLNESLKEMILHEFFGNEEMHKALMDMEKNVFKGNVSSFQGAEKLYIYFNEMLRKNGK
jgi:LAO/AO transport system kinase